MLGSRLQSFEEMFTHGGTELADKISRDSHALGGLITQHLAEFDRTVKVYGGELVERLGQRTDEVTDSMRSHVDNFDSRVSARTSESAASMDERITRLGEALDGRINALNDALGARVMEIAKSLAEGGKEVVGALEVLGPLDGQHLAAEVERDQRVVSYQLDGVDAALQRLRRALHGRDDAAVFRAHADQMTG